MSTLLNTAIIPFMPVSYYPNQMIAFFSFLHETQILLLPKAMCATDALALSASPRTYSPSLSMIFSVVQPMYPSLCLFQICKFADLPTQDE